MWEVFTAPEDVIRRDCWAGGGGRAGRNDRGASGGGRWEIVPGVGYVPDYRGF